MKWLVSILMSAFLVLFVSETGIAQGLATAAPEIDDKAEPDSSRILITRPGMVEYGPYGTGGSEWLRQIGAFYGVYGWGFEYTTRPENSHIYGSLFISGMTNPGRRIPDIQHFTMAGLTIGYEIPLHHINLPGVPTRDEIFRAILDDAQIYIRLGPGFGMAANRRRNGEVEMHPGVYATTTIGALANVAQRTSFFIELGSRFAWFPTLAEMHFVGGPQMTLGFLVFPPKHISFYDY